MPRVVPLVACHTNSYGRYGPRAAIERVRDAGLTAIELPIRTAGVQSRLGEEPLVTDQSGPAEVEAAARLLETQGVRLACATCLAGNPLDAAERAVLVKKLRRAADLGAPVALVNAGSAGNESQRQELVAHLCALGDEAGRLGLVLCCELQRGVCVNHREMRLFLNEVNHPRVRAGFDTAGIFYYNEIIEGEVALAKVCASVGHVRLKDSMGEFGRWYSPALGRGGAVNFLRVYQIMRDCGFRGAYSIAVEGIEGEPELSLDEHHQRVVESVEYLQSLGYFD